MRQRGRIKWNSNSINDYKKSNKCMYMYIEFASEHVCAFKSAAVSDLCHATHSQNAFQLWNRQQQLFGEWHFQHILTMPMDKGHNMHNHQIHKSRKVINRRKLPRCLPFLQSVLQHPMNQHQSHALSSVGRLALSLTAFATRKICKHWAILIYI